MILRKINFYKKKVKLLIELERKFKNQKPIMGGMEGIKVRNDKIQDLAAKLAKLQKEKSAMYGKKDVVTETVTKITTMEPVAML